MRNLFHILLLAPALAFAQQGSIAADPDRMESRIEALGRFGTNPEGGVSRIAYSDADIAGREYIRELMEAAGLDVRIDAAGNLIGGRPLSVPSRRPIRLPAASMRTSSPASSISSRTYSLPARSASE